MRIFNVDGLIFSEYSVFSGEESTFQEGAAICIISELQNYRLVDAIMPSVKKNCFITDTAHYGIEPFS